MHVHFESDLRDQHFFYMKIALRNICEETKNDLLSTGHSMIVRQEAGTGKQRLSPRCKPCFTSFAAIAPCHRIAYGCSWPLPLRRCASSWQRRTTDSNLIPSPQHTSCKSGCSLYNRKQPTLVPPGHPRT